MSIDTIRCSKCGQPSGFDPSSGDVYCEKCYGGWADYETATESTIRDLLNQPKQPVAPEVIAGSRFYYNPETDYRMASDLEIVCGICHEVTCIDACTCDGCEYDRSIEEDDARRHDERYPS